MTILLFAHLIAVGLWVGCVAVEIVAELVSKSFPPESNFIAALHWRVDQFVEIPALVAVLITGAMMLPSAPTTWIVLAKIGFGLTAVGLNIVCAGLVYRRYQCQLDGDMRGYQCADVWHERVGVWVVVSMLVALVLGGVYLVG